MHRVSDTVRSTHGQDGAIVLDIRHGQMFNLNFVGSRILELLKDGSAQPQIVDEIVRDGPHGAIALAGAATAIVIGLWFAFYFLVFLPRGVIQ